MLPFRGSMMLAGSIDGLVGTSSVAIQNANAVTGSTLGQNIPLPPGAKIGDLCIQVVGNVNQDTGPGVSIPSTPSGWTLLFAGVITNGATSTEACWAGYKVLDATDIANGYVLGATAGRNTSGVTGKFAYYGQSIAVIRGVGAPVGSAVGGATGGAVYNAAAVPCGSVATKSGAARFILAIAAGAPNDSPAFTLSGETVGFADVFKGGVCNGGMMMLAYAAAYTNGTAAQMTAYSPFAFVGNSGCYELPAL